MGAEGSWILEGTPFHRRSKVNQSDLASDAARRKGAMRARVGGKTRTLGNNRWVDRLTPSSGNMPKPDLRPHFTTYQWSPTTTLAVE